MAAGPVAHGMAHTLTARVTVRERVTARESVTARERVAAVRVKVVWPGAGLGGRELVALLRIRSPGVHLGHLLSVLYSHSGLGRAWHCGKSIKRPDDLFRTAYDPVQ